MEENHPGKEKASRKILGGVGRELKLTPSFAAASG